MALTDKLTAIANAVRSKTGGTEPMNLDEMPLFINSIPTEDEFWDAIQNNGNRVMYETAFNYWGCEYLRPKYKVAPDKTSRTINMFSNNPYLKKVESRYFDLSGCNGANISTSAGHRDTFILCAALEEVEDIGMQAWYYYQTFRACSSLHTISVIRFEEDTPISNAFMYCYALKNITIKGTIGQNGFNVQWSAELSKASFISIINALSDTTTALTVTFSKAAKTAAFTDEEWAALIHTKPNWTISLI